MWRHLFGIFICLVFLSETQAQKIQWSDRRGGSGKYSFACDFDLNGNMSYGMHTHSTSSYLHFGQYDQNGSSNFYKTLSGTTWGYLFDLAVDDQGNIYITGSFDSSVDFDPGFGSNTLFGSSSGEGFVAKYDSTGAFLWAEDVGGINSSLRALALDNSNNVLVAGDSGDDIIFSKLNGSNGSVLFTKTLVGTSQSSTAFDIEVDHTGSIYLCGEIDDSIDFDPSPAQADVYKLWRGAFLAKYSSAGNFIWAIDAKSSGSSEANNIELDALGNVYMTGDFWSGLNFTSDNSQYISSNGANDLFIAKFSDTGNLIWQKGFGGNSYDNGYALEILNDTTFYMGGDVRDSVYFGSPGMGIQSQYAQDPFMIKFDSSGTVNGTWHFPTTSQGSLHDITKGHNGELGVAGYFSGTIDLTPQQTGHDYYSGGSSSENAFFASFCADEVGSVANISGPDTLCANTVDTLEFSVPEVPNADSYSWIVPPAFNILGKSDTNHIEVVLGAGVQTGSVRAVAFGGCSSPDTSAYHQVFVPGNTVQLNPQSPMGFCIGDTAIVIASNELSYSVYVDSVFQQTIQADTFRFAGKQADFDIYLIYQDSLGCTQSTSEITVNINPFPNVKINSSKPNLEVCEGEPVTITASGAILSEIYRNGIQVGGTAFVADSIMPGDYFYAKGESLQGCTDYSDTITFTVKPKPLPAISANDSDLVVSQGQTVIFTASGGNYYDFYLNGTKVKSSSDSTYTLANPQAGDEIFAMVSEDDCIAFTDTLQLNMNTGLGEDMATWLNWYPVPVDGQLVLDFMDGGSYEIVISNSMGKALSRVQRDLNGNEKVKIDFSGFPSAWYYIFIYSGENQGVLKVPVSH